MTILVTGATGGLAASVISRLVKTSGEQLIATGRSPGDGVDYVRCDLSEREAVNALISRVRPRLLVHLAGSFENDFTADVVVNTLCAGWIVEALQSTGVDARVVLIGSAAEYGLIAPQDNPVAETQPLRPVSVYGLTKAMQTQVARHYVDARGADVVTARLFNVVGPGLSQRLFAGRAERQIEQYKRGELQQLEFGNLDSERDYLTSEEAAEAIALVADRGQRGEVYNVGSGRPISMRELLQQMLERAGCSGATVIHRPVEGRAAVVDLPRIYADVRKLRALSP